MNVDALHSSLPYLTELLLFPPVIDDAYSPLYSACMARKLSTSVRLDVEDAEALARAPMGCRLLTSFARVYVSSRLNTTAAVDGHLRPAFLSRRVPNWVRSLSYSKTSGTEVSPYC